MTSSFSGFNRGTTAGTTYGYVKGLAYSAELNYVVYGSPSISTTNFTLDSGKTLNFYAGSEPHKVAGGTLPVAGFVNNGTVTMTDAANVTTSEATPLGIQLNSGALINNNSVILANEQKVKVNYAATGTPVPIVTGVDSETQAQKYAITTNELRNTYDTGDFKVDGDTPGIDYTFWVDVLTFKTGTAMTVSMAEGKESTTQRIELTVMSGKKKLEINEEIEDNPLLIKNMELTPEERCVVGQNVKTGDRRQSEQRTVEEFKKYFKCDEEYRIEITQTVERPYVATGDTVALYNEYGELQDSLEIAIRGDIRMGCDGMIGIEDCTEFSNSLLKADLGWSSLLYEAADFNGDGHVDLADYTALSNYLLGI